MWFVASIRNEPLANEVVIHLALDKRLSAFVSLMKEN
jgi:hypothetical protein